MRTSRPSLQFRGSRKDERGLAAVEFVIAMPALFLVMLAVAEIGRALVYYDTLSYSIRNSARFVSENVIPGDTGVISDELIASVKGDALKLAVYGSVDAGDKPLLPEGQAMTVTVSRLNDHDVQVVAVYPYEPMLGSAVLPSLSMRVAVTMRAIS